MEAKKKVIDKPHCCDSCQGEDHLNIKSNLCQHNPKSFWYHKMNLPPYFNPKSKCAHCGLIGHKMVRSTLCAANPTNINDTNFIPFTFSSDPNHPNYKKLQQLPNNGTILNKQYTHVKLIDLNDHPENENLNTDPNNEKFLKINEN